MSGNSSVGSRQIYEAGDQRNYSQKEANDSQRYNMGNPNAHSALDSKDQRTHANQIGGATSLPDDNEYPSEQAKQIDQDATLPARAHGNEPSKGAKIDQELREEEEAELRRKGRGDAMPGKK